LQLQKNSSGIKELMERRKWIKAARDVEGKKRLRENLDLFHEKNFIEEKGHKKKIVPEKKKKH